MSAMVGELRYQWPSSMAATVMPNSKPELIKGNGDRKLAVAIRVGPDVAPSSVAKEEYLFE